MAIKRYLSQTNLLILAQKDLLNKIAIDLFVYLAVYYQHLISKYYLNFNSQNFLLNLFQD